jgi:hypothetical protein
MGVLIASYGVVIRRHEKRKLNIQQLGIWNIKMQIHPMQNVRLICDVITLGEVSHILKGESPCRERVRAAEKINCPKMHPYNHPLHSPFLKCFH